MEALYVVLGAFAAFLGSVFLNRWQRRADARSTLYLDLLPEFRERAASVARIANQNPASGNVPYFSDETTWPSEHDTDRIYRYSALSGRRDVERALAVRAAWRQVVTSLDPDEGSLKQLVIANKDVAAAAEKTVGVVDEYASVLQLRFLRWFGAPRGGRAH